MLLLAAPVAARTPLGPARISVDGAPPITRNAPWLAPAGSRHLRARFRLDWDGRPVALLLTDMREAVTVSLNGVPLFSNAAGPGDPVLGWNHPYRITLPAALLRPGANIITVDVAAAPPWALGLGQVEAGPPAAVEAAFARQQFWRIDGPRSANASLLLLWLLVLLLWRARRRQPELLLLVVVGLGWWLRSLHFHVTRPPIDTGLFAAISRESIFIVVPVTFCYCLEFARLPQARRWQLGLLAAGFAGLVLRQILIGLGQADLPSALLLILMGLGTAGLLLWSAWQRRGPDQALIIAVVALNTGFAVHDLGRIHLLHWWEGAGFFFQPFAGLSLFAAFFISLGRQFVAALTATEGMNLALERAVASARADLAASEERRRALEVERAIEGERERLMREMHDGIGANLVAAVAVAERQGQPPGTIAPLRRALADLKLTVDSLEPVDGDMVALLASLRHRIASDLAAAGIAVDWQVAPCPALAWLDAANALHVLRLFQEAISNAIQHSGAQRIAIGCAPRVHQGQPGIAAWVADDGRGFALSAATGRGLAHMHGRAAALHGQLTIATTAGTNISLWLPLAR
ncbi:hypothetical protein CHU93_01980 [Sandarakinorhabdus cyanobacteriorum]|uniref:Histidine kinase/HSP90-like ATPase domain-containing protein n=1 Tax=Sandarakinorhabdus cyanobacteriorum TaxID=1981098 RepID=A0A255Z2B6_9SPHN|nr:hypothetical protein CHU93_01980 [Sandarakinorhabdus cyanobacteriorum]